jgi:hypothetical protein
MFGVRPGLGTHPHADQTVHRSGGSLSGHLNPRCRVWGSRHHGDTRPALLPSVEGPTSEGTGVESRMSEIFKDGRISHS